MAALTRVSDAPWNEGLNTSGLARTRAITRFVICSSEASSVSVLGTFYCSKKCEVLYPGRADVGYISEFCFDLFEGLDPEQISEELERAHFRKLGGIQVI